MTSAITSCLSAGWWSTRSHVAYAQPSSRLFASRYHCGGPARRWGLARTGGAGQGITRSGRSSCRSCRSWRSWWQRCHRAHTTSALPLPARQTSADVGSHHSYTSRSRGCGRTNGKRRGVQSWHVLCRTLVRFTVFGLVAATAPILERGRLLLTLRYPARRWGPRLSHWHRPERSTAATPDGLWRPFQR